MNTPTRHLVVVSTTAARQPRTYRLVDAGRAARRAAAYRRLAVAILGLDVATLAAELSRVRRAA
jgi:hypothetical protein